MFVVEVGYSPGCPIVPDQRVAWVLVGGESEIDATLLAAQMVACHCAMVTSTRILV